jgi:hypothetical protein
MRFLGNRGYLLHKSGHGGTGSGHGGTGSGHGGTGSGIGTGAATFPRRGRSNTPGGVSGLITRHTRETVGSKSPQVGLSNGPGARAIMYGGRV